MATEEKWICSVCGTENSTRYEVCFKCGNVNALATGYTTEIPVPVKKEKAKKPRKKWGLIVSIVLLTLVATFLTGSYLCCIAAENAYEQGYYARAAEMAQYDLLFSEQYREENLVEEGRGLQEQDSHVEALAIFESFPENAVACELANDSRLTLAREKLDDGELDEALAYMDAITDPALDTTALRNEAYTRMAENKLKAGELKSASEALTKVKDKTYADQYRRAILEIDKKNYYDALTIAREYAGDSTLQIPTAVWDKVITEALESAESNAITEGLQICAARAAMNGPGDFSAATYEESATETLRTFAIPVDQRYADPIPGMNAAISEWDNCLDECGNSSDGKVLILWEITNYDTNKVERYVAWDLMELLPMELIPLQLSEVGRVVHIKCSGYKEGYYDSDTDAVRERVQIMATNGVEGRAFHTSTRYTGDECPGTIFTKGAEHEYGGLPVEQLRAAVYTVLQKLVPAE